MAKPYKDVMDFAFFAVNFHYSKADYMALTPAEKAFIYKAWEDKTVSDTTLIRGAVLNAVSNALRKKNARFRKLWKKANAPSDKERALADIKIAEEVERKEGKGWIDKILRANGFKKKAKGGDVNA